MDPRDDHIQWIEERNRRLAAKINQLQAQLNASSTKKKTPGEEELTRRIKELEAEKMKLNGRIEALLDEPEENAITIALRQEHKEAGIDHASLCKKLREANKRVEELGRQLT